MKTVRKESTGKQKREVLILRQRKMRTERVKKKRKRKTNKRGELLTLSRKAGSRQTRINSLLS